jgi:hypothetical protein
LAGAFKGKLTALKDGGDFSLAPVGIGIGIGIGIG